MPAVYLPHGGGPISYVEMGLPPREVIEMVDYWTTLGGLRTKRPAALLVISAHWEASLPTVLSGSNPPLLYDYFGFPPAAYEIEWPAPGQPALASRVRTLLDEAGIDSAEDAERGFDHGTFVPLGRSFPDADIPTIQLSLKSGLDPIEHIAIGRALAPLRDEGVLIVGSGMSYHNMRAFNDPAASADADAFDLWLRDTIESLPLEREARLVAWESAPSARLAHPREEHLLPLMVVVGSAGGDLGRVSFRGAMAGKTVCAAEFG